MRILILGAGKMGSFFTDILSFQHETAVFDVNPHQLRFVYNTYRFTTLEEGLRAGAGHQCRYGEIHAGRFPPSAAGTAQRLHYQRHRFGKDRIEEILR